MIKRNNRFDAGGCRKIPFLALATACVFSACQPNLNTESEEQRIARVQDEKFQHCLDLAASDGSRETLNDDPELSADVKKIVVALSASNTQEVANTLLESHEASDFKNASESEKNQVVCLATLWYVEDSDDEVSSETLSLVSPKTASKGAKAVKEGAVLLSKTKAAQLSRQIAGKTIAAVKTAPAELKQAIRRARLAQIYARDAKRTFEQQCKLLSSTVNITVKSERVSKQINFLSPEERRKLYGLRIHGGRFFKSDSTTPFDSNGKTVNIIIDQSRKLTIYETSRTIREHLGGQSQVIGVFKVEKIVNGRVEGMILPAHKDMTDKAMDASMEVLRVSGTDLGATAMRYPGHFKEEVWEKTR